VLGLGDRDIGRERTPLMYSGQETDVPIYISSMTNADAVLLSIILMRDVSACG
jgi:hypothetical protein